jgi:hypothetical protein
MAITRHTLVPRFPILKLEAGSYSSSETRLDFTAFLEDSVRVIDQQAVSLTDTAWSLRIYDETSSVHAENDKLGAGSISYRPPSPSLPDLGGDCVVQANLSSSAFASLLASCLAGRIPQYIFLEVDGLEDGGDGVLQWDRSVHSTLAVTSIEMSVDLGVQEMNQSSGDA